MTHGNVDGEIGAEAASVSDDTGVRIFETHEREDFVEDVFLVLPVPFDASGGMCPSAVEAFRVDSVDAVELKESLFQFLAQNLGEAQVLVFVESSPSCREDEDFSAGVTEHQKRLSRPLHQLWYSRFTL